MFDCRHCKKEFNELVMESVAEYCETNDFEEQIIGYIESIIEEKLGLLQNSKSEQ